MSTAMRTALVLDALEQAIHQRRAEGCPDLVHHSDRGVQYLSMRYTERLADAGIAPSVGSRGDSYDNALAESLIGLYKTEVIGRRDRWAGDRHRPVMPVRERMRAGGDPRPGIPIGPGSTRRDL